MEIMIIVAMVVLLGIATYYIYHLIKERKLKKMQELEKAEIIQKAQIKNDLNIARDIANYTDEEKEADIITLKQSFRTCEQAYNLHQITYDEYQKELKAISEQLDYLEQKYGIN